MVKARYTKEENDARVMAVIDADRRYHDALNLERTSSEARQVRRSSRPTITTGDDLAELAERVTQANALRHAEPHQVAAVVGLKAPQTAGNIDADQVPERSGNVRAPLGVGHERQPPAVRVDRDSNAERTRP